MRKVFSLLVIILFMSSVTTASGKIKSIKNHNYDNCSYQASTIEYLAVFYGFPQTEAYEMGSNSFANCVDNVNLEAASYWRNN